MLSSRIKVKPVLTRMRGSKAELGEVLSTRKIFLNVLGILDLSH